MYPEHDQIVSVNSQEYPSYPKRYQRLRILQDDLSYMDARKTWPENLSLKQNCPGCQQNLEKSVIFILASGLHDLTGPRRCKADVDWRTKNIVTVDATYYYFFFFVIFFFTLQITQMTVTQFYTFI